MSYHSQISNLETKYKLVEQKINNLKNSSDFDLVEMNSLLDEKNRYLKELSRLRKLQWDEDHERVEFDDDR